MRFGGFLCDKPIKTDFALYFSSDVKKSIYTTKTQIGLFRAKFGVISQSGCEIAC